MEATSGNIHYLIDGTKLHDEFKSLVNRVKENNKIHLFTQAKIETIEGSIGHFKTKIAMNGTSKEIRARNGHRGNGRKRVSSQRNICMERMKGSSHNWNWSTG